MAEYADIPEEAKYGDLEYARRGYTILPGI